MDGTLVTGWPLEFMQNSSFQQPLLGDLNNDGTLDMVGGSFNFDINNKQVFLYVWNTGLPYNPTKIVNAMYQFNPQHTGIYVDPTTVPVELESFTSSVVDNNVTLNWITATELNNLGFEIERKSHTERSGSVNDWEQIGFVNGKGTTTEKQVYSITDENLAEGEYAYRLVQIDFDGTVTVAGNIIVNVGGVVNSFALEQNYPNPFNPATLIKYNIPEQSAVQLSVVNILGEVVAELVNEVQTEGIHTKLFDASKLSSGIYFAVLNATSLTTGKASSQMIKMVYMK